METCRGEDDVCISSTGYGIVLLLISYLFIFQVYKTKNDPLGGIPPKPPFPAALICSPK